MEIRKQQYQLNGAVRESIVKNQLHPIDMQPKLLGR
jgi:hypothetical protein